MSLSRSNALLALAGLLAALLLAEGAVRFFRLGPLPLAVFEAHPTRMFTLAPGKDVLFVGDEFVTRVRIGPDGLRNPALAPAASAGRPRVLAVGDSFTFGYGVEESEAWPARLQEKLREAGLARAEVINAGVVAYCPGACGPGWPATPGFLFSPGCACTGCSSRWGCARPRACFTPPTFRTPLATRMPTPSTGRRSRITSCRSAANPRGREPD
ncbi:MAG: hypothetical protein ACE5FC_06025 [Myxococcota bacterium]